MIPVFTVWSEKNNGILCSRHVLPMYTKTVLNDIKRCLERKWAHKTEIRQERWHITKAEKL